MSKSRGIQVAYNGVCWGGEMGAGSTVSRQQIEGHDWNLSYTDGVFRSRFEVAMVNLEDKDAELLSLESLRVPDANLGVASGQKRTWANLTISGATLTDDDAGALWTSDDVGMPISIGGRGTAQIIGFTNANTITLSASLGDGSTLTAYMGAPILRVLPQTFVGGYSLRTDVQYPKGQPQNTGRSWVVDFEARYLVDPAEGRGVNGEGRWPTAGVSVQYDPSGFARVIFTGRYSAKDDSGSPLDAVARYRANVTRWVTNVLSYLSITNYETDPAAQSERWNERRDVVDFVLTYQELNRPEIDDVRSWSNLSITGKNVTDVGLSGQWTSDDVGKPLAVTDRGIVSIETYVDADNITTITELGDGTGLVGRMESNVNTKRVQVTLERLGNYSSGLQSAKAPIFARASWSCHIDGAFLSYSEIASYYLGTVKPYIKAEAQREYGGAPTIMDETARTETGAGGLRVSGTMLLYMRGSGSKHIHYEKTVQYRSTPNWQRRKLLDGEDGSYVRFSAGRVDTAQVTVTRTYDGVLGRVSELPIYTHPPVAPGASGSWVADDDVWTRSRRWVGRNPEGGSVRKFTSTVAVQFYTWETKKAIQPPAWEPGRVPTSTPHRLETGGTQEREPQPPQRVETGSGR